MTEILFLRHSLTAGNLQGRYIGSRTDEPLCTEGRELLKEILYPRVHRVYASPMLRCVETAKCIWPELGEEIRLIPELRECDFGDFENRNYEELNGNPDYQAWIDSNGRLPFPHGESMEDFKKRCVKGFLKITEEFIQMEAARKQETEEVFRAAIVAHGGTIMAVLEQCGCPKREYFDYQVKNGRGYLLTPVEGTELWNCQCWP